MKRIIFRSRFYNKCVIECSKIISRQIIIPFSVCSWIDMTQHLPELLASRRDRGRAGFVYTWTHKKHLPLHSRPLYIMICLSAGGITVQTAPYGNINPTAWNSKRLLEGPDLQKTNDNQQEEPFREWVDHEDSVAIEWGTLGVFYVMGQIMNENMRPMWMPPVRNKSYHEGDRGSNEPLYITQLTKKRYFTSK